MKNSSDGDIIKMENWSVGTISPYASPEMGSVLQGNVYNHPRFADGDFIITSPIKDYKDGLFISKTGHKYSLGKVDDKYEKAFPNAFDRLMKVVAEW
jgi:hypothetical protein